MEITCDTDRFVREVIEGNEYSYIFKDMTVLDVGCNIGTFSFWISKLAKVVYAIDFAQENIDMLRLNAAKNNIENVIPFCMGIGGIGGPRYVERTGPASGGSWSFAGKSEFIVQAKTVENFMSDEGIEYVDLLKLDVEGAEVEILTGSSFPFDRVGAICGETHNSQWETIRNILIGNRYRWMGNDTHFIARKR